MIPGEGGSKGEADAESLNSGFHDTWDLLSSYESSEDETCLGVVGAFLMVIFCMALRTSRDGMSLSLVKCSWGRLKSLLSLSEDGIGGEVMILLQLACG